MILDVGPYLLPFVAQIVSETIRARSNLFETRKQEIHKESNGGKQSIKIELKIKVQSLDFDILISWERYGA